MRLGIERLHVRVGHQQHLRVGQRLGVGEVLDVDRFHGHAALEQRQGLAVEVGQLRILVSVVGREALEHQRIGHQDADAAASRYLRPGCGHVVQRVDHHLHLRGVVARDALLALAVGTGAVQPLVDALGPRHHLIVGDVRVEQLRGECGLVVPLVVGPVARPVLDRVGQEEHLAAGRCGHRLHRSVFEVGRLEDALAEPSVVVVRLARGAGPDLGDVAVHARQRGQTRLRTDDLPLRVIDQRVGRDVALHIHPLAAAVLLGEGEDLAQGIVVELVLELVGQVGVLGRFVLGAPLGAVVLFPFPFEGLAVTRAGPELGLLHEDGVDAGVDDPFHVALLHVGQVVVGRDDVGHQMSVPDGVTAALHLSFVEVGTSVPLAGEVVLVFAPGDSGHEVHRVSAVAPRADAVFEIAVAVFVRGVASDAVYHHGIGAVVDCGPPFAGGLEGGLHLPVRLGLRRSNERRGGQTQDGCM